MMVQISVRQTTGFVGDNKSSHSLLLQLIENYRTAYCP